MDTVWVNPDHGFDFIIGRVVTKNNLINITLRILHLGFPEWHVVVSVCVHVCVHVFVSVCVHVCVHVFVSVCVHVIIIIIIPNS